MTLRALAVLGAVDVVAAEDTRHSQRLLDAYGLKVRMMAVHQHNEQAAAGQLIDHLAGGRQVALINSMTKKQKQNLNPELLAGGAAALGAVLPNAYNASAKAFTAGMASNQTSLKFAKKSWITHGPKIKQLVKGIVLK